MPKDTLQGTLDLLVLQMLARGAQHGYGIVCQILTQEIGIRMALGATRGHVHALIFYRRFGYRIRRGNGTDASTSR